MSGCICTVYHGGLRPRLVFDPRCPKHGERAPMPDNPGEKPMDYLHPLETFRADSRDTEAPQALSADERQSLIRRAKAAHTFTAEDILRYEATLTLNTPDAQAWQFAYSAFIGRKDDHEFAYYFARLARDYVSKVETAASVPEDHDGE